MLQEKKKGIFLLTMGTTPETSAAEVPSRTTGHYGKFLSRTFSADCSCLRGSVLFYWSQMTRVSSLNPGDQQRDDRSFTESSTYVQGVLMAGIITLF